MATGRVGEIAAVEIRRLSCCWPHKTDVRIQLAQCRGEIPASEGRILTHNWPASRGPQTRGPKLPQRSRNRAEEHHSQRTQVLKQQGVQQGYQRQQLMQSDNTDDRRDDNRSN